MTLAPHKPPCIITLLTDEAHPVHVVCTRFIPCIFSMKPLLKESLQHMGSYVEPKIWIFFCEQVKAGRDKKALRSWGSEKGG